MATTIGFQTTSSSGSESTTSVSLTLTLDASTGADVTVNYTVNSNSTAKNYPAGYYDINLPNGTATIPAGQTTTTIDFTVVNDSRYEDDETVIIDIYAPTNATLDPTASQATYTITDDDSQPSMSFQTSTSTNPEGAWAAVIIELSAAAGKTVTADWTISDLTTTSSDYNSGSGSISITEGSSTYTLYIYLNDDGLDEDDETFSIALSNFFNATSGSITTHQMTISDINDPPSIGFSSTSASQNESAGAVSVFIELSTVSGLDVSVNYSISGTATGSSTDHDLSAGTATITAGNANTTIDFNILEDGLDEDNETILIILNSPTNATLGSADTMTITIVDNDSEPFVSFDAASSTGAESSSPANLTVSLNTASGRSVQVNYGVTGGTATGSGTDYTLANGTLTFPAGVTSKDISAVIVDDNLAEDTETIEVTISSPTNATLGTNTVHTYSITDNDSPPTIGFSTASSTSSEGDGQVGITVALSAVSGQNISFDYSITGGTATAGSDYTFTPGTATISAGNSDTTITVTLIDDALDENDSETIVFTISNVTNASLSTATHTKTITDNDNAPSIQFSETSSSGSESSSPVNLTVQLGAVSALDASVDYAIGVGSTATGSGTDYTLSSGTLTISAGDSTGVISITITNDAIDENNETVIVQLSNPVNCSLGTNSSYTYTINDDDNPPTVSFSAASASGSESSTAVSIPVEISAVSGLDVSVDYAVSGGTATGSGTDYTLSSGTLTISAGSTSGSISLTVVEDALDEINETVIVQISNPSNASLGATQSYTYTIEDNDPTPQIAFSTSAGTVSENDGTATVTIQLNAASGINTSVDYSVTGGDATGGGTDFSLADGTASISAGDVSTTLSIPITQDALDERDETLVITLSNPVNATIGLDTTYTLTIIDDDNPAKIAFSSSTSSVNEGTTPASITVTLSAVSGVTTSVDYAVSGGTATGSGTDYTLASGTVSIAPGDLTTTFDVTIVDDILDEDNETVILTLSNPDSADLGTTTTHTLTITDNDNSPSIQFSSTSASGSEGGGTVTIQLELSAVSGRDVMVDYAPTDIEAVGSGTDYTLASGTDTITAGNLTSSITLTLVDDALDEGDETMQVDISNPVNASPGTNTTYTYTITDNDPLPVIGFSTSTASGDESTSNVSLTVTLTPVSGREVTVDYAAGTGTATGSGTDFTFTDGSLTFAVGETSKTLSLTVADDGLDEIDEMVLIVLSNPGQATLGTDTLTYTILDNDDPPVVAFDLLSSTGLESVDSIYFDVSLTAVSGKDVSVDYSVGASSTATGGNVDYSLPSGTLTFPAGTTTGSILVTIINDQLDEDNETIVVELSDPPTNAILGANATHTYTIIDNDASPVDFTVGSVRTQGAPSLVGYWNASNTGLVVKVPVDNDPVLVGGQIQIQARSGSSAYKNLGSAYTILNGDLADSAQVTITASQFQSFSDYVEGAEIEFTAVITDIYGNSTTGTASSEKIIIDTTPPGIFNTGTFSAIGGLEVTGYWNGTNTDVTASISIDLDSTLAGGYVYLLGGIDNANYTQIGDSTGILAGNLNTSMDITAPAADITSLTGYQTEGVNLWLNAVIIDRAGNQKIGNVSSTILQIDANQPTVTNVTSPETDRAYKEGDTLIIQVVASENIFVSGTPRLTLETGSSDASISYSTGSGSTTIEFEYVVEAWQTSSDLDYTATTALSLNGGTIRDAGGNDLVLTLPAPGAAGSLAANKDIVIDTEAPAATLSYSDSLVRFEDGTVLITATFTDSMSLDSLPKITVTFPGSGSPDISSAAMTYVSGSVWQYNLSLLDNVDGIVTITLNGRDKALNVLPGSAVTGGNVLRIDNTDPVFTSVSPDTGSFINHKRLGWTLSETLASGTVTFTRLSGPGSTVSATLSGTELEVGTRAPSEITNTGDLSLVDGTVYRLTLTGIDSAGNTGAISLQNITYDTTAPTVALTYDQYYASSDTSVFITATFNEKILPTPLISVDFTGTGQDISNQTMTIGADSTVWTYALAIPTGTANNGIANVTITATDLALNSLRTENITGRDTLMVDNSAPSVTFSYENISQPNLTNEGKGGDIIRITASFSEVTKTSPAPELTIQYSDTTVTGVVNSGTTGDSTWTFDITLLSSPVEANLIVNVTAEDLAGNSITSTTDGDIFFLDNIAPTTFTTGDVTTTGLNPVLGWINGRTDSVKVSVPVPSTDGTLLFGGKVDVQMTIPARMGTNNWVTVGTADSIIQFGTHLADRSMNAVAAAFAGLATPITLAQGDTVYTRAILTDRVGNTTNGATAVRTLIYDPSPPTIGTLIGGNVVTNDTLISTDSLTVVWSDFTDPVPATASGTAYYEVAVEHLGDATINTFMDWDSVGLSLVGRYRLPTMHQETYRMHIRAFDQAGNISDTLSSNVIRRLNSAPVFASVDTQRVDEDVALSVQLQATDVDTATLLGDTLHFSIIDTGIVNPTHPVTVDELSGLLTWNTPLQQDTGSYQLRIRVGDEWGFADTTTFIVSVISVNDTPQVVITPPSNAISFIEDHTDLVQLNLTPFAADVDNDSTELTWQAVILDTTTKDGYPLGIVVPGPGSDAGMVSTLERMYSGFTSTKAQPRGSRIDAQALMPFAQKISVTIDTLNGSTFATFDSDTNYYGANHRILFYVSDPHGATAMDTVFLTVLPDNDPPVVAAIPDTTVLENDSLRLDFARWVTDVDDTALTFTITALTNPDKMTLTPASFVSQGFGDSVLLRPQSLWSDSAVIQIIATDSYSMSDTAVFVLDIIRVPRPALGISVVQNNAFTNYYDIVITDTLEKVVSLNLTVQNEAVALDTAGFYTYVGRYLFTTPGTYTFQVNAQGIVGDTSVTRQVGLALARVVSPWTGGSSDGRLQISGSPGAVSFDQAIMIYDSSMIKPHLARYARYRVGNRGNLLEEPIQVSLESPFEEQALYYSADGIGWEELPSITEDGQIKAWTRQLGYFKLGEQTIIVPGMTSIQLNYPNPFNPVTTLVYDIGFADGPDQQVEIVVFNVLGQQVATLLKAYQPIGRHQIQWNGRDQSGQTVSSGVYFIQLHTNKGRIKSRKVMLLR